MAAPTNVRIEANSIATATLRWDYAGAASVAAYRSTDGISYSVVAASYTSPGTTSYTDTELSVGTKYWYKLSDDAGSTFSSVVTVYTHSCLSPVSSGNQPVTLPRFDSQETTQLFGNTSQVSGFTDLNSQETLDRMNEMARRIEAAFAGQEAAPGQCIACPEDGAVVIDCSSGCINWTVVADQDINSVSIQWCGTFDGSIDFVVPPNTTVGICGFPAGFGFGGDECIQAPISGGANGRTAGVKWSGSGGGSGGGGGAVLGGSTSSKPRVDKGIGNGGGGGGSGTGCTCVSVDGALTIKSCNANNSMACAHPTNKRLMLKVCGGRGPYTWTHSGSIKFQGVIGDHSTDTDTVINPYIDKTPQVVVVPPVNSGSAVAGDAYIFRHYICTSTTCSGATCSNVQAESQIRYSCNDVAGACQAVSGGTPPSGATVGAACCPEAGEERCPSSTCPDFGNGVNIVDDVRTAPMISAGCNPCGLQAGSTVTVTDSLGTQVTIVLRA